MTGPRGAGTLADVLPRVLAHLGGAPVDGSPAFTLPPAERVCLALVDGLGTRLLERAAHADAPFLGSLLPSAIHLASGFPSSTPISLCSLGTGRGSGEHGIVGFFLRPSTEPAVIECLTWAEPGTRRPLIERFPPETLQPFPSRLADAATLGIRTGVVSLAEHESSGLTRAAFRGVEWIGLEHNSDVEERVAKVGAALVEAPSLVYTYDPRPDFAAHRAGVDSDAWREALRRTDGLLRTLHDRLPRGTLLLVTGDHGAVDVPDRHRLDLALRPDLLRDVETVTGDARARYIHAHAGRAAAVEAAWRAGLDGAHWAVRTRDQAIGDGWFGPTVRDEVRQRIGDVVAAAIGDEILLDLGRYPWEATFRAFHGGLTPDEVEVPLLVAPG
jgi:hypothetical protein